METADGYSLLWPHFSSHLCFPGPCTVMWSKVPVLSWIRNLPAGLAQPLTEAIWDGVSFVIKYGHLTPFCLPFPAQRERQIPHQVNAHLWIPSSQSFSTQRSDSIRYNMSSAVFPGGRTLSPLYCVQLGALSLLLVCRENPTSTSCLTSLSKDFPLSKCSIHLKCWHF